MKNKSSILCLFLFLLFFTSCKKEPSSSIVGQWMSVADYRKQENGTSNWTPTSRFPNFFIFYPNGKFGRGSDIPAGGGVYNYDNSLETLILNYETDRYGNTARTEVCKVEELTNSKMVISYFSSSGNFLYKTEYSKIN
jgi:hypothetical protein